MNKLLVAFRSNRSVKNARKLREYYLVHPMTACVLNSEELELLEDAKGRIPCSY